MNDSRVKDLQDRVHKRQKRIEALEKMLRKKLDLIKSGIAHNYSGDPYENELYLEVRQLLDAPSD